MAATEIVLKNSIEYAERALARSRGAVDAKASEHSWHAGRASAYEDMAGLLRMGLDAVKEAEAAR